PKTCYELSGTKRSMQMNSISFLIGEIKKLVSENDILQARYFVALNDSVCILGLFYCEIWFLTGPAVNSQLGVNLLGQYFGREAISNQ
ncbi:MAG: hypothetical protein VYE46_03355, partial [Cyanobacteriota bacterium]|nr:hypothetical protein [Cyanobacteriota bacterium]